MASDVGVRDDPDLTSAEKETLIHWSRDDERLRIHSEQAVVVKWLVRHPQFRERDRRVKDGVLHAVTGTLPVGALKLSGSPRKSNQPGRVLGKLPGDDDAD